jgi:hypothetical protein
MLEWRKKYNNVETSRWQRIHFDTPYLKEPLQYDINILPKEEYVSYFDSHLSFIQENITNDKEGFSNLEYEKFRRVVDYFKSTTYNENKVKKGRQDFLKFFAEQDRRRHINAEETFPEMKEFFNLCFKESMHG